MESFPNLKEGQFAIIRADFNTGTVLDEEFNYAIKDSQKVYNIVDGLSNAISRAKTMIIERGSVECIIYDHSHNLASYITPNNINSF